MGLIIDAPITVDDFTNAQLEQRRRQFIRQVLNIDSTFSMSSARMMFRLVDDVLWNHRQTFCNVTEFLGMEKGNVSAIYQRLIEEMMRDGSDMHMERLLVIFSLSIYCQNEFKVDLKEGVFRLMDEEVFQNIETMYANEWAPIVRNTYLQHELIERVTYAPMLFLQLWNML